MKRSTVSNTSDTDELTKNFYGHIGVCKIKEACSEILQKGNFSFKMVSMDKVKKVVLKFNSKKSSMYGAVPAGILKQTNYRGPFEISDKHYQSFFQRIHFS